MLPHKPTKKVHFELPAEYRTSPQSASSALPQPQAHVPVASTSSAPQPAPSAPASTPARPPPQPVIPPPPRVAETSHLPLITTTPNHYVPPAPAPASQPMGNVAPARLPPVVTKAKDRSATAVTVPAIHLNPLLRPRSELMYNMVYDPAQAYAGDGMLTAWQREQSISKPEQLRMHLIVDFPWAANDPAHMRPSGVFFVESRRRKPLQLAELLTELHSWLHGRIEQHEWDRVTDAQREIATRSFYARTERTPRDRQDGLRRIDWFGDRTFFGGIEPFQGHTDIWRLILVPAKHAGPRRH